MGTGWLQIEAVYDFGAYPNARFSRYLLNQLEDGINRRELNASMIMDQVQRIELPNSAVAQSGQTKPPSEFHGQHLKGFHHAHFMQASFIPKNLANHWAGKRLTKAIEAAIAECEAAGESDPLRVSHVLADRVVSGGFEQRAASNALTGEWLIYKVHEEKRYYLLLAKHVVTGSQDELRLSERLAAVCRDEFPFLLQT